jgi:hypothetical protein
MKPDTRMRDSLFKLAFFAVLAAAWLISAPATFAQADFTLHVSVITSEHSRDSNSVTKTLRVLGNTLVYSETYHGARSNRHPPINKEFNLTDEDRARLIGLLKDQALLQTKSISQPLEENGPGRDFAVKIAARLAGEEGLISIKALRTAAELKTDPLYQGSVLLIAELSKIMRRTDRDIAFDVLIK